MIVSGGQAIFDSPSGNASSANLQLSVGTGAMRCSTPISSSRELDLTGGSAAMSDGGRRVLLTDSLSIDAESVLDLAGSDLIIRAAASTRDGVLTQINDLIRSGRNSTPGLWLGKGITSSSAAADLTKLSGLAVILNDKGDGTPIYDTFDGQTVDANSILVKYTWNGDMDLNGKIDADDYFAIDSGFLAAGALKGYRNGDLDFSGKVDADDYFLIDSAFLGQSQAGSGTSAIGVPVPEPACALLVGAAAMVLRRRRR